MSYTNHREEILLLSIQKYIKKQSLLTNSYIRNVIIIKKDFSVRCLI